MHFCWLAMLIGEHFDSPKMLNDFTSNHFAMAGKNQWTKIGVHECSLLLNRFYGGNDDE